MNSHTTSIDLIRERSRIQHTRITNRTGETEVTRSIAREDAGDLNNYLRAMSKFVIRLGTQRAKAEAEKESTDVISVAAFVETGRRFDKVFVMEARRDKSKATVTLVYFVERETGTIYGVKSPVAPNLNHYFGTVETITLWDWSGEHAEPYDLDAAGVVEGRGYGAYRHFEPKVQVARAS